ncbi:hypothetical protein V5O48_007372 [Marasmius crinis-equi]|uniref:F-box domain-containing protein n=1 Tax=Marasmius crinis-equi TaxID=585013 RepID=A0ABR3FHB1_9AGAR
MDEIGFKARERKLREIDDRILELARETRQLQNHRNLLVPISILPTELLGKIFTFHVVQDLSEGWDERKSEHCKWINILHVCHHWRKIAHNTPSVWSSPDFRYPDLAREMITLSSQAALNLEMRLDRLHAETNKKRVEVLSAALQRLSRIDRLVLEQGRQHFESLLQHDLLQPAPVLRSLSFINRSASQVFLPSSFLGGEAPLLSELRLDGCHIPWDSALLQNLVVLVMDIADHPSPPTLEQVTTTLVRMPNLEILVLRDCSPELGPEGSHDIIQTRRLRYLELSGEAAPCGELLNRLLISSDTRVNLQCAVADDIEKKLSSSFSELMKAAERTPKALFLRYDDEIMDGVVEISAWMTEIDRDDFRLEDDVLGIEYEDSMSDLGRGLTPSSSTPPYPRPPHTHLRAFAEDGSSTLEHELPLKALDVTPCSQLLYLHLAGDVLDGKEIIEYFGQLPSLRTVLFSNSCPSSLLYALNEVRAGGVYFPALHTLGFRNITFIEWSVYHPGHMHADYLDDLMRCLDNRTSWGSPVQRLVIRRCIDFVRGESDRRILGKHEYLDLDWDGFQDRSSSPELS